MTRPTCAVVDLGAIARNYRRLAGRLAGQAILPVVKADAYGHGALPVARRLVAEGAARFAVALMEEGVALRRGGVAGDLLVLGHSDPSDVPQLRAYGLTPTLHAIDQARGFAEATRRLPDPLAVHVKLETGMGRLGFREQETPALLDLLRGAPGLRVAGAFTNFSQADEPASDATARQIGRMRSGVEALRAAGFPPATVHAANSAAVLAHPDSFFDAVRPGLALYGVSPFAESDEGLEPALTLETRVIAVHDVPEGAALGYGGRFVTRRASRVATIPIGYHDGLRRVFSGRSFVLLRGRRVPLVGAVSMDLTLLDATDSGAEAGDRVVCLGTDGSDHVTAWELARAADTIPYEILCGIGPRVPRQYVD
ncbi:MAG: alanine racemase [Thermoanaerobaculia bacterium]|nr:alanine racemase [Thermoanaerobaculia bacterium]